MMDTDCTSMPSCDLRTKTRAAMLALQRRDFAEISTIVQQLRLDQPNDKYLLSLSGICRKELGDLGGAERDFNSADSARNKCDQHQQLFIAALVVTGDLDRAHLECQERVERVPQDGDAWRDLAVIAHARREYSAAEAAGRRVLQGIQSCDMAYIVADSLYHQGKLHEAIDFFHLAIELSPDFAIGYHSLGNSFRFLGDAEKSIKYFAEAVRISKASLSRYLFATTLPIIYQSNDDIAKYRARLTREIHDAYQHGVRFDVSKDEIPPLFMLAYQGQNDRDIHESLAMLCVDSKAGEQRRYAKWQAKKPIRLCIVSSCLFDHPVGRCWDGTISQLSKDTFDITIISLSKHSDATTERLKRNSARYVRADSIAQARASILNSESDVLVYLDVGLDSRMLPLAASRLSPMQCAWWGHPVTTGLTTIDYFISSTLLEDVGAQSHYTERLEQLNTLGIYCREIVPPEATKPREFFGLPEEGHIYACLQSLFKLHPNFDRIVQSILRRDRSGFVVLVEGSIPNWSTLLKTRLIRSLGQDFERVIFVPRLGYNDFLSIHRHIDVLLVPHEFGGGQTSYEGLSLGVPIVTWPSHLLRGRITYALYKKMQFFECVAHNEDDYVNIAVKLGTDHEWSRDVRAKIKALSPILFEDIAAVDELSAFFKRITAEVGNVPDRRALEDNG